MPIRLPPNCTHAFQPLDVGVFSPMKRNWSGILRKWYRESRLRSVDKSVFPTLLRSLWSTLEPNNLRSGFRGAGLFPVNRQMVERAIVGPEDRTEPVGLSTPDLLMRRAILSVLAPAPISTVDNANRAGRKRSRVSRNGEVLTESDVMERLKQTSEKRVSKKQKIDHEQIAVAIAENDTVDTPSEPCAPVSQFSTTVIPGDGNCMFSAFSLGVFGRCDKKTTRQVNNF